MRNRMQEVPRPILRHSFERVPWGFVERIETIDLQGKSLN
jgi:hypothetical protein